MYERSGIATVYQRLVGKELEDNQLLLDYHIHQDCQLTMLGRLKGGMSQQSAPQQYTGDNKEGFEYWLKYSGDLTKGVLKEP